MARPTFRGWTASIVSILAFAYTAPMLGQSPTPDEHRDEPVKSFAPGVKIDWPSLTVEVAGEVVLREGALELFSCSPRTREHESILRCDARPLHVHQALGLIGLSPGSPSRYDEQSARRSEARGDPLDIRVRFQGESGEHVIPADRWVTYAKNAPHSVDAPPLNWIFAGSRTLPDGRFAADLEGTVACLVDFDSALIALGSAHSPDNDQLWLTANTQEIPPRGTRCTLLIRSDHRPTVEVELLDEHTVRYKDQSLTADLLVKLLRPPPDDPRPGRLHIRHAATVPDQAAKAFVEKITKSGFEGLIETKPRP